MSLGMQWRTVQIVVDINTIRVYDFTRSWRQDPSVGSFKQHCKWIFLSDFFFEYLLSNLNPRSQPWKTRCFNEQVIAIFVFFYCAKKTCSLLFVFVLKAIKCLLQGFGIFNAFFFRTGKASLIRRARSIKAQFPPELKHKRKNIQWNLCIVQLKINCLPLLWDHIGPPWRPGQPHQPRWAWPFRQQTHPGRT